MTLDFRKVCARRAHHQQKHPAFPNPPSPGQTCRCLPVSRAGAFLVELQDPSLKPELFQGFTCSLTAAARRRANKESHQWPRARWWQVSLPVTLSGFPLCWKPSSSLKAQCVAKKILLFIPFFFLEEQSYGRPNTTWLFHCSPQFHQGFVFLHKSNWHEIKWDKTQININTAFNMRFYHFIPTLAHGASKLLCSAWSHFQI